MSRLAYYRVSTADQSVESQRQAMGGQFDREFKDEGVSGSTVAAHRKGFAKLLDFVREGDTVCVYAVDRLGRDAIDVQTTVRRLLDQGVTVDVHGLGSIGRGVGELILGVLAQIADMERQRIFERCEAGRGAAREALKLTGKTHRGKASLGRPAAQDPTAVIAWKIANKASIGSTATQFGIGTTTVKRYMAAAAPAKARVHLTG